jgi:hypothetical protein
MLSEQMASAIRAFAPYLAGLLLLGVAVARVLPGALDAACGIAGVLLMGVYAFATARSGALGHRRTGTGSEHPYLGDGASAGGGAGHDSHGGHGSDGGWFGGDFGGGHGGGHGGH